jgi:DNA-binding response OmpR family regulator
MSKKILVVDDDPTILRLIATRLKANNYDVVTASDAVFAVKKAHEEKPDLIILDIKMPAGGGMSVVENLKMASHTMLIPILCITAEASPEIKRKVTELGAEDFLAKPFHADELLSRVRKALGEDKPPEIP